MSMPAHHRVTPLDLGAGRAVGHGSAGSFEGPSSGRSSGRSGSAVDGDGGGTGTDDADALRKNTLSDAVIRKLKVRNQQLEVDLKDQIKQTEELRRGVESWKKNIKDRHNAKIEQVYRILTGEHVCVCVCDGVLCRCRCRCLHA